MFDKEVWTGKSNMKKIREKVNNKKNDLEAADIRSKP